ncbi:nuclear transport factor 2 family protein [Pseudooceanicola marinus]|uniref:nuclear transport factor 2 family protein n=1 Tax=Pseudooceanicola marinus TaxID=396013 RepID=UPI001C939569|nr:nuclear transport factor 2 family protein [Pseudooceanicola marinus]MBY5973656.1 nuclear transport factor 2 family protein [Ferrimonas balearica]MCA1338223.1 nuclear transport factor 2 family protein [Pseudooceanicola marinus]
MSDLSEIHGDILARLDRLEAESACRRCLSDYMDICDRLDADTDLDALGALFTEEAVWGGAGDRYAKDFGAHHGRAAIIGWLGQFCTTPPHFAMNAHFLSSEAITHGDDGTVTGRWLMLQTPTFHDGQSFLMAARLEIDFAYEAGAWRMHRFSTRNLYARPVGDWNAPAQIPAPAAGH